MLGVLGCLLVGDFSQEVGERSGIKFQVGDIFFIPKELSIYVYIYIYTVYICMDPPMEGFEPV